MCTNTRRTLSIVDIDGCQHPHEKSSSRPVGFGKPAIREIDLRIGNVSFFQSLHDQRIDYV